MKKFIEEIRKEEPEEKLLHFEDLQRIDECEREFEDFGADPFEKMTGLPFSEMVEETNLSYAMHMGILITLTQLMSVILEHEAMNNFASVINKTFKKYASKKDKSISPIFISLWSLYDARVPQDEGTFARLLLELREDFSLDNEIVQIIKLSSPSYPMIYQYLGLEKGLVILKDIITDKIYHVYHADYHGAIGEIWYARLLAPINNHDPYVTLSPPYIFKNEQESDWLEYLQNHGITKRDPHVRIKLENYMKYGPSLNYWHDYLIQAFEKEIPSQCIYLNGLPEGNKSRQ